LLHALLQLILLAEPGLAPQLEQLALAGQRFLDVGIVCRCGELLRRLEGLRAVALGGETRLARVELGKTLGDNGEIGAGHGLVEANENVAGLHPVAVAHPQLADHAAGRVLHLLDVRIDDDRALRDQRAGNLRRRRPAPNSDRQERHDHDAGEDVAADRGVRARPRFALHPAPP
jgi:hypothetical protein